MKVYIASSWSHPKQPHMVQLLRAAGHEVYDFKNPDLNHRGFDWKDLDPEWQSWSADRFCEILTHPVVEENFAFDQAALNKADALVLLLPSGHSSHLELGYAAGQGKRTLILLDDPIYKPELMYKLCTKLCVSEYEVLRALKE